MKRNPDLKRLGKKTLFAANGKRDAYDPDGSITKRGAQFLDSLRLTVPESVIMVSKDYEDEGHVPFPSVYDGLQFIYAHEKAANK